MGLVTLINIERQANLEDLAAVHAYCDTRWHKKEDYIIASDSLSFLRPEGIWT